MRRIAASRTVAALMLAMTSFNGAFLTVNGLSMLVDPFPWGNHVPAAATVEFSNQHLVRGIGLIRLLLGVAFTIGMIHPARRVGLWAAATLWLTAYAVFHLWEGAAGVYSPTIIPHDFPLVSLLAVNGALLTLWAIRRARAGSTTLS